MKRAREFFRKNKPGNEKDDSIIGFALSTTYIIIGIILLFISSRICSGLMSRLLPFVFLGIGIIGFIIEVIILKKLREENVYLTEKQKIRRRKKRLIIYLILFLLIFVLSFFLCRYREYDIRRGPLVNMIKINRVIVTSNICDKEWIESVEDLVDRMAREYEIIRTLQHDEIDTRTIRQFNALKREVKKALREMLEYLERSSSDTLENHILIDNLEHAFRAYREFHTEHIARN